MNKLWQRILVTVLGGIIFFFVFQKFSRETTPKLINKRRCELEEEVTKLRLNGILSKTYRNEEADLVMELVSLISSDTIQSYIFLGESSGVIDKLQPGDTIGKKQGSLDLIVSRNGREEVFKLIYNCDSY